MLFKGATTAFVRYFSRERSVNVRKINPKVPPQEASAIAKHLYQIIKDNGPLTVPKTWDYAKEAGISGLNSKTHMKLMLKWMRGRKMLKLFCTHVGSSKKFLHSTFSEEPQIASGQNSTPAVLKTASPGGKKKKERRKS